MSDRRGLIVALMSQIVFFSSVIMTSGFERMIFFGLFWIGTFAMLLALVNCKRWDSTEWLGFGAFGAVIITAVLISSQALQDVVGVSVPVLGLLFVAAINAAIPERKRRVILKKDVPLQNKNIFHVIEESSKFHRVGCRMLKNKKFKYSFSSVKEARAATFSPCSFCVK